MFQVFYLIKFVYVLYFVKDLFSAVHYILCMYIIFWQLGIYIIYILFQLWIIQGGKKVMLKTLNIFNRVLL